VVSYVTVIEFDPSNDDAQERSKGHPLSLANFIVREISESLVTSEASGNLAELSGILGLKAYGSTSPRNSEDACK
jgi:hypothetical protein